MFEELNTTTQKAAKALLGAELIRTIGRNKIRVRIVEVEAYDQNDEASHTYIGKTKRNEAMFGPAGHLYVYFIYGMYSCCNVVTGQNGFGQGALIRAVEPLEGLEYMHALRNAKGVNISNGPGKLCQALNIDRSLNKHDLTKKPVQLILNEHLKPKEIVTTTRIGLSRAQHLARRYYIKDNPYISLK